MSKLVTARKGYKKATRNILPINSGLLNIPDKNIFLTAGSIDEKSSFNGAEGANKTNLWSRGLNAGIGALANPVGDILGNAIAGGYEGAGTTVGKIGGTIGSAVGAINPVAGAIISVGSKLLGGLGNRAFGIKTNQAALKAAKNSIALLGSYRASFGSVDDVKGLLSVANFLNPFKGGWFRSAASKNLELKDLFIEKKDFAGRSLDNGVYNLGNDMLNNALARQVAFGGPIDVVDPSTPIGYSIYTDKYMKKNDNNGLTNMFAGMPNSMFAFGGNTLTHGSTFLSGLTHIDKGGSHEENFEQGVLMGVDNQGTPNLVEEGEVIYDDYVFSNRLTVPKHKYAKGGKLKKGEELPYELKILKPYEGLTFADAAKKIEKKSGIVDRPNDPIAIRGFEAGLGVLYTSQEREREKEKLREMQEAIDNMTPEELQALQQLMAMAQQLSELQAMAEQQQLMMPEGMEYMQQPTEELQPIAALGGLLNTPDNIYDHGGKLNTKKLENLLKLYGLSLADYYRYWLEANNTNNDDITALLLAIKDNPENLNEAVNDANLDIKFAQAYLDKLSKQRKALERVYKKNNKHFDYTKLNDYAKAAFNEDFKQIINNPTLLEEDLDELLNISKFRNNGEDISFNHYATNAARNNYLTTMPVNENGKFNISYPLTEGVTSPAAAPYIDDMYQWDATKNKWLDVQGKEVDNVFGENTKFSNVSGGTIPGEFSTQDDLTKYYLDKIKDRFISLGRLNENSKDADFAKQYLTKPELQEWISDLSSSSNTKDRALAEMLKANWNLDADNLIESDAYLGLDAVLNNALQRDAKPGREHIPYIAAASPYTADRYLEIGEDNKPTGKWVNYAPNSGFTIINPDNPVIEGGVNTYQVRKTDLNNHVGVRFDANGNPIAYYLLDPTTIDKLLTQLILNTDPRYKSLTPFENAADGYNFTPYYYELNDDAYKALGFDDKGYKINRTTGGTDPFPKAAEWPYLAGAGLQGLTLLYNTLSPKDYSNADAMIKAALNAGTYNPIEFRPIGNYLTYKPDDPWFYTSPIMAQSNATLRALANKVSPSTGAETIANNYNTMLALGQAQRQLLDSNFNKYVKVGEYNKDTDKFNSEGFLKADMANLDAANRARAYTLEGLRNGYMMRLAIDDARANAINMGVNGLANLAFTYGQQKDYNNLLKWRANQAVDGNGIYFEDDKRHLAKGGKIKRRKKGLSF